MGLLFGSAGAHTYLKSGQVAPPPSFRPNLFIFGWDFIDSDNFEGQKVKCFKVSIRLSDSTPK